MPWSNRSRQSRCPPLACRRLPARRVDSARLLRLHRSRLLVRPRGSSTVSSAVGQRHAHRAARRRQRGLAPPRRRPAVNVCTRVHRRRAVGAAHRAAVRRLRARARPSAERRRVRRVLRVDPHQSRRAGFSSQRNRTDRGDRRVRRDAARDSARAEVRPPPVDCAAICRGLMAGYGAASARGRRSRRSRSAPSAAAAPARLQSGRRSRARPWRAHGERAAPSHDATRPQVELPAAERRMSNVADAFAIARFGRAGDVRGKVDRPRGRCRDHRRDAGGVCATC